MSKSTQRPGPTRPLLRYFGGKWQLRHWILDHLPAHEFYAEPFAGAASVLLAKDPAPRGEIINDLNEDLINLFRVMQHPTRSKRLLAMLQWTPYAKAEFDYCRAPATCPVERARRLVVRSFMGIEVSGTVSSGSGFRMGNVSLANFDQDGKRTFRNCARDWSNWKSNLETIRDRLSEVMIYQRDALEFIDLMDCPGCLLYVDPPYSHEARSSTRYQVEMGDVGHQSLIDKLLRTRSMVVISGYDSPMYAILSRLGWVVVKRAYRANMSLRRRTECLWISPSAQARLNQQHGHEQGGNAASLSD